MRYDAFLSYSHGDDDGLADDLERSLARLVRPWYSTRPFIRVQRDTSSFRAGSSLDTVIKDALDRSDHLVCLISPTYASSSWSNQEIEHWLTTRGEEDVTFAVAEWGELGADGEPLQSLSDFDWDGEDVPPAVRDRFPEPLAVDLRWATDHDARRLENDRWDDAVATVAASIKGRNKDEFFGELVAMRARARIITGAMVVGLLIMLGATAVSVPGWLAARSAQASAEEAAEAARADRARAERAADEAAAAADAARADQRRAERAADAAAAEAEEARAAAAEAGLAQREAEARQAEAERLQREAERLQAESEAAARRAADLQAQAEAAARRAADLQAQAEAAAQLAAERQAAAEKAAADAEARARRADALAARQLTLTRSERLSGQALGRPPSELDLSLLLAAESWLAVADLGPDSSGSDPAVDGPSISTLVSLLGAAPALDGFLHGASETRLLAVAAAAPRAVGLSFTPTQQFEVWDTVSTRLLRSIPNVSTEAESVLGIMPDGRRYVRVSPDLSSLYLIDVGSRGTFGAFCCAGFDGFAAVDLSDDGSTIVAVTADMQDPQVLTWRTAAADRTWPYESAADVAPVGADSSQPATSVAVSPDGTAIAVGFENGLLQVDHREPVGGLCATCRTPPWQGHAARVSDLHFDDDGTLWSASADGTVRSWLIEHGAGPTAAGPAIAAGAPVLSVDSNQQLLLLLDGSGRVRTMRRDPAGPEGQPDPLRRLDVHADADVARFTADGRVVSNGPGPIRLLDPLNRGQIGRRIRTNTDVVAALAARSGEPIAYVVTAGGRVEVWNVTTARRVGVLRHEGATSSSGAATAALSPDGSNLAVLTGARELLVISTADGSLLAGVALGTEDLSEIAFVDDDELVLHVDGRLVFKQVRTLRPSGRAPVRARVDHSAFGPSVVEAAHDAPRIAYRERNDAGPVVVVHDLSSHRRWELPVDASMSDLALSPDGSRLAVSYTSAGRVDVLDLASLGEPLALEVPGASPSFYSVTFGPGDTIVAGTSGGTVVWSRGSGSVVEIDDHSERIAPVEVSAAPGSAFVVSRQGRELTTIPLHGPGLVAEACRRAGRNLTEAEWSNYMGDGAWRATCP